MNIYKQESKALKKLYKKVESQLGLTYKVVATRIGLGEENRSYISSMMNGHQVISRDWAPKIAEVIGCDVQDFSPRLALEEREIANRYVARVNGIEGDVGYLLDASDEEVIRIMTQRDNVERRVYWHGKHSDHTYLLRVKGKANEPQLPRGSVAVVDRDLEPEDGKLFAFVRGRLQFARWNGDGYAEYLNPDYPDRVFPVDDIEPIGRVLGVQMEFD